MITCQLGPEKLNSRLNDFVISDGHPSEEDRAIVCQFIFTWRGVKAKPIIIRLEENDYNQMVIQLVVFNSIVFTLSTRTTKVWLTLLTRCDSD